MQKSEQILAQSAKVDRIAGPAKTDRMPAPGPFTVADLNTRGELQLKAEYWYAELERIPGAIDVIAQFSAYLWRSPDEFETTLPQARTSLKFRWKASAKTAGIATLRSGTELASLSLLAAGLDAAADQITLQTFQSYLLQEWHDTGVEPAFALMDLPERPLVATINFRGPRDPTDQLLVALADRCFAASYFRYHSLV